MARALCPPKHLFFRNTNPQQPLLVVHEGLPPAFFKNLNGWAFFCARFPERTGKLPNLAMLVPSGNSVFPINPE